MLRKGLAVMLVATIASCSAPVAIGAVAVGGGGLVATKAIYKGDCDGEGCRYGNALAFMLGVVSLSLVVVGGVSLSIDE
jgi:hypothetical protein